MTRREVESWAVWLQERLGAFVFAVDHPGLPRCAGAHRPGQPCDGTRGKHPCGRWSRDSTDSPETIRAALSRGLRNVGIDCGKSGLLVVDEDRPGAFGASGAQARYENFRLLADDLTDRAYTLPKGEPRTPVITLPHNFFANGWHLALSPAEVAVLLMVRHAERTFSASTEEPGVAVPRSTRWAVYGISGEAYEAIHELEEFGLLSVYDTMPHRRHGKLRLLSSPLKVAVEADGDSTSPVPYRLETAPFNAFDRRALEIIRQSLRNHRVPPRLD